MEALPITTVRKNVYRLVDQVIRTGNPVKIKRKGKELKIVLDGKVDKFLLLEPHGAIVGDPDDLVRAHPYSWQEPNKL